MDPSLLASLLLDLNLIPYPSPSSPSSSTSLNISTLLNRCWLTIDPPSKNPLPQTLTLTPTLFPGLRSTLLSNSSPPPPTRTPCFPSTSASPCSSSPPTLPTPTAPAVDARALIPVQPKSNGSSSALIISKHRKARSAEMVRISSLCVRDQIYYRDVVRRIHITYKCLRALIIQEEEKVGSSGLLGKRIPTNLKAAAQRGKGKGCVWIFGGEGRGE